MHDTAPEILIAVAADARLTEDLALALLKHHDLPREALEALSKNGSLMRQRKVRMAVVIAPRTPRHVSVPTIRHLYTFELMQVALLPSVQPDVKRAAEEVLISKLASISSGERATLARRSSGRVAAALAAGQRRAHHAGCAGQSADDGSIDCEAIESRTWD